MEDELAAKNKEILPITEKTFLMSQQQKTLKIEEG